ncbi:hypothetical protein MTR67_018786 [Solanum verrucosum]|uniref:Tf2-1-like SH3-like domain-containing protein n=1 Tax=Solanum verrucosum TaxID=315347 RepID=A0AAF0TMP7_SOLVR|nr:hypothetical protein MTR67_018786 [Solanum verrucosum]
MKRDIAKFVARCSNFQQVKVEHQGTGGLTQDIGIPTWKWEEVNMDFVVGLPRTRRQHDSIWVIVDRFTKSTNFLPVKVSYSAEDYAKLYIKEIVKVKLSTAFHPQTDGQEERTIQSLEDMLRACVIDFKGEFALLGPKVVYEATEKVLLIRDRLKMAHNRQKSYALNRKRDLEFEVGDWVYLKISPMKWVMRFGKKGKLSPRYVGPDEILKRVEGLGVDENHSYEEAPVEILDRQVKKLRNKEVASVKVLWRNNLVEGATWEAEANMKSRYPNLFPYYS